MFEELLQKIKFAIECKNEAQAIRTLEQYDYFKNEKTIEFAKWVDKHYFQGGKFNTYAKSKEDFLNKKDVFTIEELFVIFNKRTQAE